MIDAIILTKHDWANTGWRFFKCLQYLELNAMMFKGEMHPFCYPEQGVIHPAIQEAEGGFPLWRVPELAHFVNHSRVIHFTSSSIIDTGVDLRNKNVVLQHSGNGYREGHPGMNKTFNPFVDATIIQMPDLLGLGAKNEHLIYFPVDTDFIQPVYKRQSDKLIIGHYPSMQRFKGSQEILNLIEKLEAEKDLKDRFIYRGPRDPGNLDNLDIAIWTEHLKRVAHCDVIIDVFNPVVRGNQYGEWGNTSFEAAAMGKLVVTNSLRFDEYTKNYGDCELNIANNISELESVLRKLITMNPEELAQKRVKTRHWVELKHSIPATANRLWGKVYKEFF
jgi:hypothetical protein